MNGAHSGSLRRDSGDSTLSIEDVIAAVKAAPEIFQKAAPKAVTYVTPPLTDREVQVMIGWLSTDSKREAGELLKISQTTVSAHISRIRAKYAAIGRPAPSKAHLLARALQDGYTDIHDW